MSIIKSIKQVLGLGPAAENHFWDGSVPNQLSLKRGTPEAPGAELIKALNGVLSFPNQGQSLTPNGYVKLPGGLIVQWGRDTQAAGDVAVAFPIQFPTACFSVSCTMESFASGTQLYSCSVDGVTSGGFNARKRNASGNPAAVSSATEPILWIAIGY